MLDKVEGMMKPTTVKLFEEHFKEGYDVETDELYCTWLKLKKLKISNSEPVQHTSGSHPIVTCEEPLGLNDIIQHPNPPATSKKGKSTNDMPKHLTGEQMFKYFEEKKAAKEKLEEEKRERKKERERKKKERENEKERRRLERERKKLEKEKVASLRSRARGAKEKGRGKECLTRSEHVAVRGKADGRNKGDQDVLSSGSDSCDDTNTSISNNSDDYQCTVYETTTEGNWIACDSCNKWYHQNCVAVTAPEDLDIWFCADCEIQL